eukprot:CAMPEP_0202898206 /NCGR_PEP_ID=MMETSP1392-20130828/6783_1 /ASSEMBLY_ACC=CAM_ASM_000868 /TAXON_ID=225041 /ORGANISM="Chlamydomonas chlamydogama, Strain SAG 11-48b" /LENGTH=105 /DNA_ID=CAMNT_0049584065 /DNA_START=626 /DNA_END=939 /DNA_ORIENTATION=+
MSSASCTSRGVWEKVQPGAQHSPESSSCLQGSVVVGSWEKGQSSPRVQRPLVWCLQGTWVRVMGTQSWEKVHVAPLVQRPMRQKRHSCFVTSYRFFLPPLPPDAL